MPFLARADKPRAAEPVHADDLVTATPGLIVDGDAAGHQIGKSALLATLRTAVREAAQQELAGTDWTTDNCPWFDYWFSYYERRSPRELEAAMRRWAPGTAEAAAGGDYIAPVVARVRAAVAHWRASGEVDSPMELTPTVSKAEQVAMSLGAGEPLESPVRSRMEGALGTSLASVRVHTDDVGARVASEDGAQAVAVGSHVAFARGAYQPGTDVGDALLAHELAHTQQQARAVEQTGHVPALEANADAVAVGALARLWGGSQQLAAHGARAASAGLQLQRCKGLAHAPDDLEKLTLQEKAAWITKAMGDDQVGAEEEIVRVFQTVKTEAEFRDLQKLLDMKRVLKYESDFGAAMIGTLGPLLEGQDILIPKWIALIIDESAYSVPVTEPFVHLFFSRMATNHMKTVLRGLADRGKLGKTIGHMPTVLELVKKRGIDIKSFNDRTGSGARKLVRGVWSAIKGFLTPQLASDKDKNEHASRHYTWSKRLPPAYQQWHGDVWNAIQTAATEEMLKPSNIVIGQFDYLTFGVPVGAVHLVKGTIQGAYHVGTGDYEQAGEELAGALIVLVTHATAKAYVAIRTKMASAEAGVAAGQIQLDTGMAAVEEVALSPEGQALAKRLLDKLGPEKVQRVAGYLEADSEARLFAVEHGEAAYYALDEAGGNVAAAQKLVAAAEQRVAAEAAAAAKAAATAPEPTKPPEPAKPPEAKPPETKPPEAKPPETKPPETKPPETKPPETKPPETKPPETTPPEAAKPPQPAKPPKPAKATKPAKAAKPAKPAKPTKPAKAPAPTREPNPPFPADEFPETDPSWKQWPPPEPSKTKPRWDEPGGARYRYDRYRYDKWVENGKPATAPEGLLEPQDYFDRHIAPKARGQSPGELGGPKHRAKVQKVRDDNKIGTRTMGKQRPDAVGNIDQPIAVGDRVITPKPGGRVLYEAEEFFKDGSQMVSEGREQVRQFRKDNPDATIVVEDVESGNIVVYEPGTQPPGAGRLPAGTSNIETVEVSSQ